MEKPVIARGGILHIDGHAHLILTWKSAPWPGHGLFQGLCEDPLRAEGEEDRSARHQTSRENVSFHIFSSFSFDSLHGKASSLKSRQVTQQQGPCTLQGALHVGGVHSHGSTIHLLHPFEETAAIADVTLSEHHSCICEVLCTQGSPWTTESALQKSSKAKRQMALVAVPKLGSHGPAQIARSSLRRGLCLSSHPLISFNVITHIIYCTESLFLNNA